MLSASADKANAAAAAENQAVTDNATAVTTLNTTVTDLKANQTSLATTGVAIKKDIANPSASPLQGNHPSHQEGFTAGRNNLSQQGHGRRYSHRIHFDSIRTGPPVGP